MLTLTDSFIQYLSTSLANSPAVNWVHVGVAPDSHLLKMDTLNVSVLHVAEDGNMEEALVSLDLIGSDERQVLTWLASVRHLLSDVNLVTPEYDYTNPSSPTATGRLVSWASNIQFQLVASAEHFLQFNATFPIRHARN